MRVGAFNCNLLHSIIDLAQIVEQVVRQVSIFIVATAVQDMAVFRL